MSEGTLSENMGFFGNKSSTRTKRPTALLMQYIKNVSDTLSYLLQFDIFLFDASKLYCVSIDYYCTY